MHECVWESACVCVHATVNMWEWEEKLADVSSLLPRHLEGFKLRLAGRQAGGHSIFYGAPGSPTDKDWGSSAHQRRLPSAVSFIAEQPPLRLSPWPSRQSPGDPSSLRSHQSSSSPSHVGTRKSVPVSYSLVPHISTMACVCLCTSEIINKKDSFKKKLLSLEISLSASLESFLFF